MKSPQTKFHGDTMSDSKVIRSKKSKFVISLQQFFFLYRYLLKLQQQVLTCFCKFICNSDIKLDFCDFWRKNIVLPATGRLKVRYSIKMQNLLIDLRTFTDIGYFSCAFGLVLVCYP